jgi:coproporphyrinogen III oxidase
MSYIFALLQKVGDLFASPILPMDAEYSYVARHREAERIRRSHYVPFTLPRD